MTNVCLSNICPNCGVADKNDIISYHLVDIDLDIEYQCQECKHRWSNTYGLFYLGYSDSTGNYDRDGLQIRY